MSSWPSGDWPSDSAEEGQQDRPTDPNSLGKLSPRGQIIGITPEQTERALKLLSVPFDSLPQVPPFAPFFGYTTQWHKVQVASSLAGFSAEMRRVLTTTEADALAYHRSRCCAISSWSPPLVLATTLYFTWRGRATLRFPFITPDPAKINPNAFPTASRPFLTGPSAVRLWHGFRFGAYGIVCYFLVKGFVDSYAYTTYLMNVIADPRLKTIRDAAKTVRNQQSVPGTDAIQGAPGYERSTTIGSWSPQQQRQQQQQPAQQSAPQPQDAAQDDDTFLFDDASPVAPTQRQRPKQPSTSYNPSTGQGSAWDRVRSQAIAEQLNQRFEQAGEQTQQRMTDLEAALERFNNKQRRLGGRERTEQPTYGRSEQEKTEQYTYPTSEQEKAYAKEQAQKEFDAMLERERRGEGSSGGRM